MPKIVDHDRRREDLLAALWRVVARDGAEAITVRSVAAEAGVSKSNVGHYFASRTELLSAAVRQQLDGIQALFDGLVGRPMNEEAAIAAALLAVPTSPVRRRQSQVWLLLVAEGATHPEVLPVLSQLNAEVRRAARQLVGLMADAGLVAAGRDLDDETARLHALVDGLSVQTLSDRRCMPATTVRLLVTAHIRDLALPPPSAPRQVSGAAPTVAPSRKRSRP